LNPLIIVLSAIFFHTSVNVAFLVALRDCLSFIVLSLTSGQSKLYLCQTSVIKIYPQRNKGKAPLFQLRSYFVNFGFMQQQRPFPRRLVLVGARLRILRDCRTYQPAPPVVDPRIRAVQIRGPAADIF
jgi:hypothetical protein